MSQHVAHRHSDEIHELRAEIERLRATIAWVGHVRPGKNPESGGAIVHMTWDEFNAMREAIGLQADKGMRR